MLPDLTSIDVRPKLAGMSIGAVFLWLGATASVLAEGPAAGGARYDVGGYSLFIECSGQGSPTVFLDPGLDADHSEWSAVQPRVAGTTRVCSWDRAGLGKSDRRPRRGPATGEQVATELHNLLLQAGIAPPYVLVGHSIGGLDMRLYQMQYGPQVAGLVMVDATPEQQELAGTGVESGDHEAIDMRSAASTLERWSLPSQLPLGVIERGENTDSVWQAEQAALSVRSANSFLVIATSSDHRVELQQPELVAGAIAAVVDSARNQTSLTTCPAPIRVSGAVCLPPGAAQPQDGLTVTISQLLLAGGIVLLSGLGLGAIVGRFVWKARLHKSP